MLSPLWKKEPVRPGERLAETLWLRALMSEGRLPMPTVERIRWVRKLVTSWELEEDADELV